MIIVINQFHRPNYPQIYPNIYIHRLMNSLAQGAYQLLGAGIKRTGPVYLSHMIRFEQSSVMLIFQYP